jgi:hypothetical protein
MKKNKLVCVIHGHKSSGKTTFQKHLRYVTTGGDWPVKRLLCDSVRLVTHPVISEEYKICLFGNSSYKETRTYSVD